MMRQTILVYGISVALLHSVPDGPSQASTGLLLAECVHYIATFEVPKDL
jgi:hypothetical protein